MFSVVHGRSRDDAASGVVGLGAGSIACYRQPGQAWTFYEIDPAVAEIASDPKYFTYLQECAPEARIILGDGRRSLSTAAPAEYDLLILDAFSSDAVPVHLVTREAMSLYLEKLAPGGLLVFNITNRHLDLQTVIGNLAEDAGLTTRVQHDLSIDPRDAGRGKMASQWAIVARSARTTWAPSAAIRAGFGRASVPARPRGPTISAACSACMCGIRGS